MRKYQGKEFVTTIQAPDETTLEDMLTDLSDYAMSHEMDKIQDEASKFRWEKDKEALQRIELYKRIHHGKEPTVKQLKATETETRRELKEDEHLEREILGKLAPSRRRQDNTPVTTLTVTGTTLL